MGKNLNILNELNIIFSKFIYKNPKIILDELLNNVSYENNKKLFSNDNGYININKNKNNFQIFVNKSKFLGLYNIIDCGYIKIYDINLNNKLLKQNNIPNFDSFINNSNDLNYILNIIKLFKIDNAFKLKLNCLNKMSILNFIKIYSSELIKKVDKNINILNSNISTVFYIKVYESYTQSFFIDKSKKLIYYIYSENFEDHSYIFYYVLKLNSKYLIEINNK